MLPLPACLPALALLSNLGILKVAVQIDVFVLVVLQQGSECVSLYPPRGAGER